MTKAHDTSGTKLLYDAIRASCGAYLLTIEELLAPEESKACPEDLFRARLKEAIVSGVLVKRLANLLLTSGEADTIAFGDYLLSTKEACDTARFAGYEVTFSAQDFLEDTGKDPDAGRVLAAFCAFADALSAHCLPEAGKREKKERKTTLPPVSPDVLLAVKQRIHADMGGVLIASRAYLSDDTADEAARSALCGHWQRVLHGLRTGARGEDLPDVRGQILKAAKASGVQVSFDTPLPLSEEALRSYVKEASAKIVAAVRAGADTVSI